MVEIARLDPFASTELTRDAWDRFLRALDPDAAQAGSRYEQLRHRLIARYRERRLPCPEDLADQALDRVACQLICGPSARTDLGAYLHGVAERVADEASRRRREETLDLTALPRAPGADPDEPLVRLCGCLDDLPRIDRRTLLEYEAGSGHERIRRRRALAAELGIPMNALRVRVHRLRARVVAMMRDDPAAAQAPRRAAAALPASPQRTAAAPAPAMSHAA